MGSSTKSPSSTKRKSPRSSPRVSPKSSPRKSPSSRKSTNKFPSMTLNTPHDEEKAQIDREQMIKRRADRKKREKKRKSRMNPNSRKMMKASCKIGDKVRVVHLNGIKVKKHIGIIR